MQSTAPNLGQFFLVTETVGRHQCAPKCMEEKQIRILLQDFATGLIGTSAELVSEFYALSMASRSLSIACGPFSLERLAMIEEAKERRRLRDALRRLQKRKLVSINRTADRVCFLLTQEGEITALCERMAKAQRRLPAGEACILVFDVPECVRSIRSRFRNLLKRAGFERFQQSVWVHSFVVEQDIERLIDLIGLSRWVSVFVGRRVTAV